MVADGRIRRVDDGQQGNKNNKNDWCVLHEADDGFMSGSYGSWWEIVTSSPGTVTASAR